MKLWKTIALSLTVLGTAAQVGAVREDEIAETNRRMISYYTTDQGGPVLALGEEAGNFLHSKRQSELDRTNRISGSNGVFYINPEGTDFSESQSFPRDSRSDDVMGGPIVAMTAADSLAQDLQTLLDSGYRLGKILVDVKDLEDEEVVFPLFAQLLDKYGFVTLLGTSTDDISFEETGEVLRFLDQSGALEDIRTALGRHQLRGAISRLRTALESSSYSFPAALRTLTPLLESYFSSHFSLNTSDGLTLRPRPNTRPSHLPEYSFSSRPIEGLLKRRAENGIASTILMEDYIELESLGASDGPSSLVRMVRDSTSTVSRSFHHNASRDYFDALKVEVPYASTSADRILQVLDRFPNTFTTVIAQDWMTPEEITSIFEKMKHEDGVAPKIRLQANRLPLMSLKLNEVPTRFSELLAATLTSENPSVRMTEALQAFLKEAPALQMDAKGNLSWGDVAVSLVPARDAHTEGMHGLDQVLTSLAQQTDILPKIYTHFLQAQLPNIAFEFEKENLLHEVFLTLTGSPVERDLSGSFPLKLAEREDEEEEAHLLSLKKTIERVDPSGFRTFVEALDQTEEDEKLPFTSGALRVDNEGNTAIQCEANALHTGTILRVRDARGQKREVMVTSIGQDYFTVNDSLEEFEGELSFRPLSPDEAEKRDASYLPETSLNFTFEGVYSHGVTHSTVTLAQPDESNEDQGQKSGVGILVEHTSYLDQLNPLSIHIRGEENARSILQKEITPNGFLLLWCGGDLVEGEQLRSPLNFTFPGAEPSLFVEDVSPALKAVSRLRGGETDEFFGSPTAGSGTTASFAAPLYPESEEVTEPSLRMPLNTSPLDSLALLGEGARYLDVFVRDETNDWEGLIGHYVRVNRHKLPILSTREISEPGFPWTRGLVLGGNPEILKTDSIHPLGEISVSLEPDTEIATAAVDSSISGRVRGWQDFDNRGFSNSFLLHRNKANKQAFTYDRIVYLADGQSAEIVGIQTTNEWIEVYLDKELDLAVLQENNSISFSPPVERAHSATAPNVPAPSSTLETESSPFSRSAHVSAQAHADEEEEEQQTWSSGQMEAFSPSGYGLDSFRVGAEEEGGLQRAPSHPVPEAYASPFDGQFAGASAAYAPSSPTLLPNEEEPQASSHGLEVNTGSISSLILPGEGSLYLDAFVHNENDWESLVGHSMEVNGVSFTIMDAVPLSDFSWEWKLVLAGSLNQVASMSQLGETSIAFKPDTELATAAVDSSAGGRVRGWNDPNHSGKSRSFLLHRNKANEQAFTPERTLYLADGQSAQIGGLEGTNEWMYVYLNQELDLAVLQENNSISFSPPAERAHPAAAPSALALSSAAFETGSSDVLASPHAFAQAGEEEEEHQAQESGQMEVFSPSIYGLAPFRVGAEEEGGLQRAPSHPPHDVSASSFREQQTFQSGEGYLSTPVGEEISASAGSSTTLLERPVEGLSAQASAAYAFSPALLQSQEEPQASSHGREVNTGPISSLILPGEGSLYLDAFVHNENDWASLVGHSMEVNGVSFTIMDAVPVSDFSWEWKLVLVGSLNQVASMSQLGETSIAFKPDTELATAAVDSSMSGRVRGWDDPNHSGKSRSFLLHRNEANQQAYTTGNTLYLADGQSAEIVDLGMGSEWMYVYLDKELDLSVLQENNSISFSPPTGNSEEE